MHAGKLVVITDSHLGAKAGDVDLMIRFIATLEPAQTELLFLGDLFHIWAGPKKFRTELVDRLLEILREFRANGGKCYLVTGNRDVFFQEQAKRQTNSDLPFDRIAVDGLQLERKGGTLFAVHGDTINSKDFRYLRWRKLIRHWVFRLPFRLIPAPIAKKIMFALEEKLKQTNLEFRREFPDEEWIRFLERTHLSRSPVLVIAGHFHPRQTVVGVYRSTTGLVLPDWCENLFYLEVADNLTYSANQYSGKETV
jgi:UDP-2,3-diacylglucosamine pyrophosphatase LpxH